MSSHAVSHNMIFLPSQQNTIIIRMQSQSAIINDFMTAYVQSWHLSELRKQVNK